MEPATVPSVKTDLLARAVASLRFGAGSDPIGTLLAVTDLAAKARDEETHAAVMVRADALVSMLGDAPPAGILVAHPAGFHEISPAAIARAAVAPVYIDDDEPVFDPADFAGI